MSCSRCGGSSGRAPRPAPSIVVGRPGVGNINAPRPAAVSGGHPSSAIRSAITGLRYVPTK